MKTINLKVLALTIITMSASLASARPTEKEVKDFALNWFRSFDVNAPSEEFLAKLDNGFEIVFPDKTLKSADDFRNWYDQIRSEVRNPVHLIKSIEVLSQTETKTEIRIKVEWDAEEMSGKPREFNSTQTWTLSHTKDGLRIKSYIVVQDGPASNLVCTCHGGPGRYPFACAPVKKTCYGGPGNYAFDCSVCN